MDPTQALAMQVKGVAQDDERRQLAQLERDMDDAVAFEDRNPDGVGRRIASNRWEAASTAWDRLVMSLARKYKIV